jgi:purine-binding chemotaxis protein CheW
VSDIERGDDVTVGWNAARDRLGRAVAAAEATLTPSHERIKQVMDERARVLARAVVRDKVSDDQIEVLVFTLANERYAIETRFTREVIRIADFTPVPGTPEFLVGIANVRGEILPLIDLRKILGVSSVGLHDLSCVIVHGEEHAEFGVLADTADQVTALSIDDILGVADPGSRMDRDCVRGITSDALIVIDGAALLNDRRLFINHSD